MISRNVYGENALYGPSDRPADGANDERGKAMAKTKAKSAMCPQCKGRKIITVTVHEHGKSEVRDFDTSCFTCHGRGQVSEAKGKEYADAVASMCSCETTDSAKWKYHPDTKAKKHHYTCGHCGKVTQIG